AFTTYSYETDSYSEARLAFYFEVVQEAAGTHAAQRGCSIPDMHKEGKTWVITRSQIEIFRYSRWPEVLDVETWAQDPIRLHLPRAVRAFDKSGAPVFLAKTYWAVLDVSSNRPLRALDMAQRIGVPPKEDFDHQLDMKLARPEDDTESMHLLSTFKPRISYLDTDRNQHVNNISYLNWALDSLPASFRDRLKVSQADVSYLRQTFLEDDVMVYTYSEEKDAFFKNEARLAHRIERTEKEGSKTVVWEGKTVWKLREELR
ncbi:MAG: acyl-ACP thioesterase, partial [Spirochaetia bacterium]|nr:acyl-ACP thioesterase [Spirochaetia bacterium]